MAENNKNSMELPAEVAEGVYANLSVISHNSSEFVLDFARMMPGVPQPRVKARVVMAPEQAKRLMFALMENIKGYERVFGEIKLTDPRTLIPQVKDPEAGA